MRKTPSLLLLLLPGLAVAQQVKYVPPTHANVEGSSTNTYPFGRATAGLQVLVDAPWVTQGVGFVNAVSFRANGLAAGSAAVQGYSGGYRVTCWNTTVNSASLTTNPATNGGLGDANRGLQRHAHAADRHAERDHAGAVLGQGRVHDAVPVLGERRQLPDAGRDLLRARGGPAGASTRSCSTRARSPAGASRSPPAAATSPTS
jgi:hypothetical protein